MLATRTVALAALVSSFGAPEACKKIDALVKGDAPPIASAPGGATTTASSAQPAGPPLSVEEQAIAEAQTTCFTRNDCQTAHERLVITIPETSPLRQRTDYKSIENRWATTTVNDALNDPDVVGRRKLLDEVVANPLVEAPTKERARRTLAQMPTSAPSATPVVMVSDAEMAKKMAVKDPRGAREMLLPKITAGTSTKEEREVLAAVCKKLADKSCQAAVTSANKQAISR